MSIINVTNVVVRRNPAPLTDPFEFEVFFECLHPLSLDIEWKLVYVGDAEEKSKDQELDCIVMGPVQRGTLRFIFLANAPDFSKIKKEDINGITVLLLTGSYLQQEFVRVGWYIHNMFTNPQYIEEPPDMDEMPLSEIQSQMQRCILADAPRVTRFHIDWGLSGSSSQNLYSNHSFNENIADRQYTDQTMEATDVSPKFPV